MVYIVSAMLLANQMTAPISDFDPAALLDRVGDAGTLGEAVDRLGLYDVVDEDWRGVMSEFLASIPPAVDAAIVASARSALERGVRVSFVWQEAPSFEVRVWETSRGGRGVVTIFIRSVEPEREGALA